MLPTFNPKYLLKSDPEKTLKNISFSFSVVSLLFLPVWLKIFTRLGVPFIDQGFLSNQLQIPVDEQFNYAAGILTIIGLTILMGASLRLVENQSKKFHRFIFSSIVVGLILFEANIVRVFYLPFANRESILKYYGEHGLILVISIIVLALIGLYALLKFMPQLTKIVWIGFPIGLVVLVNAAGAVWLIGENAVYSPHQPLAETQIGKPKGNRVVWIIFDEFDYRLGFEKRPEGLKLPNLDKLAARSFVATQALPPHNGTLDSIASFLIGDITKRSSFGDHAIATKLSKAPESNDLGSIPTIFTALKNRGQNASALGQDYIPYCRTFGRELTSCTEINEKWRPSSKNALFHVPKFLNRFLVFVPIINRKIAPQEFDAGWQYREFLKLVQNDITNSELAMVFVHWMIPHTPYVYDRKHSRYRYASEEPENYFDNMALTDLMVKKMLDSLSKSEVSKSTTVIISSDHHWRRANSQWDGVEDFRVPFIVMLPGQSKGFRYDKNFNTVVSRSLIEAIIAGKIKNYEGIADFITNSSKSSGTRK